MKNDKQTVSATVAMFDKFVATHEINAVNESKQFLQTASGPWGRINAIATIAAHMPSGCRWARIDWKKLTKYSPERLFKVTNGPLLKRIFSEMIFKKDLRHANEKSMQEALEVAKPDQERYQELCDAVNEIIEDVDCKKATLEKRWCDARRWIELQHKGYKLLWPTSATACALLVRDLIFNRASLSDDLRLSTEASRSERNAIARAFFECQHFEVWDSLPHRWKSSAQSERLYEKLINSEAESDGLDDDELDMDLRAYEIICEVKSRLDAFRPRDSRAGIERGRLAKTYDKQAARDLAADAKQLVAALAYSYRRAGERPLTAGDLEAGALVEHELSLEDFFAMRPTLERWFERKTGEDAQTNFKKTPTHSLVKKFCDPRFWTRRVRKIRIDGLERVAQMLGMIGKSKTSKHNVYLTDETLADKRESDKQTLKFMENTYRRDAAGNIRSLAELAENSATGNEHSKMIELFKRIEGTGNLAESEGRVALFAVVTLESKHHALTTNSAQPLYSAHSEEEQQIATSYRRIRNTNFTGIGPRNAQKLLSERFALVRTALQDQGIDVYGFRTVEAHIDGCPHWNIMMYLLPEQLWQAKAIIKEKFLDDHCPNERGAQKHRVRFTDVRPTAENPRLASACAAYMAKYIFKHFQTTEIDETTEKVCSAHRAWCSVHGIRNFAFFGLPSISIYRELRRAYGLTEERLQKILDDGTIDFWPEIFQKAHAAACGYAIEMVEKRTGLFTKTAVKTIKKNEEIDFAEWLKVMKNPEGITIEIGMTENLGSSIPTDEDLIIKEQLAKILNVDDEDLGPGRYFNSLPKRAGYFLVRTPVLENGRQKKERRAGQKRAEACWSDVEVSMPERAIWAECEWSGEDKRKTFVYDAVLNRTTYVIENDTKNGEPLDLSADGFLQLFMNNPRFAQAAPALDQEDGMDENFEEISGWTTGFLERMRSLQPVSLMH